MARTTTTTSTMLSVKLLVDTKAQRVLFAEANKDVVDFLFSLLALPIATAVKLIGKECMVGSAGNLYASVKKLDASYVLPGASKDALLRPMVPSPAAASNRSLLRLPARSKGFFRCSKTACRSYVTDASGTKCPSCSNPMTATAEYVPSPGTSGGSGKAQNAASAGGAGGFVQGVVTYTVMDNLTVSPMSAISSIALLNTFAVKDIGALQEKTVQVGYKEGLEILKASLQSKTVLTDVFLGKKRRMI